MGLRTYIRWERGDSRPQAENISAIANALDIDLGELARAAGSVDPPIDVQAKEAVAGAATANARVEGLTEEVAALEAEVARPQGLVRAYKAPDPDELARLVTVAVRREVDPAAAAMADVVSPAQS